jgi:hypothetical protein
VDRAEIEAAFEDAFDAGLLFHAFANTMRDYEAIVEKSASPSSDIATRTDRYTFKACVEVEARTSLSPSTWKRSVMDDRLLNATVANELGLDGYVWGVEHQDIYPGFKLLPHSDRAHHWERMLGMPFYEATFEGNAHQFSLIFSDLSVDGVPAGWTPFEVGNNWSG